MDPFKPAGIGAVAAKNVLKLVFSQALSAPPKLKAWDDYNMNTVLHKIFIGCTANGNKPMVGGIGLTAQPAAGWWVDTLTIGAAVNSASLLKNDTGFCKLSADAPEADEELFFNINYKFPVPTGVEPNTDPKPSDTWGHVFGIEYEYTGESPAVAAYGNKGTEGSPNWQALIMGIKGYAPEPGMVVFKPCNTGEGNDGTATYLFTFPDEAAAHPDEIWCMEHAA